jgi:hypothetical protein
MAYIRGRKPRLVYNLVNKHREKRAAEYIRTITARKPKGK